MAKRRWIQSDNCFIVLFWVMFFFFVENEIFFQIFYGEIRCHILMTCENTFKTSINFIYYLYLSGFIKCLIKIHILYAGNIVHALVTSINTIICKLKNNYGINLKPVNWWFISFHFKSAFKCIATTPITMTKYECSICGSEVSISRIRLFNFDVMK